VRGEAVETYQSASHPVDRLGWGGEENVDRIWMKEVGGGGQPNGQEEK
jgi:hypothetical protein